MDRSGPNPDHASYSPLATVGLSDVQIVAVAARDVAVVPLGPSELVVAATWEIVAAVASGVDLCKDSLGDSHHHEIDGA